ncbi:MAG: glutamate cyclase domain-containing protein [Clostridia bacterium]
MEEKYGTLGYHNGRFGDFDEVTIDTLVISTVSNWGAYAVEAYMQQLKKVRLLPSYKEIKRYLETLVRMGSVDGVTVCQHGRISAGGRKRNLISP